MSPEEPEEALYFKQRIFYPQLLQKNMVDTLLSSSQKGICLQIFSFLFKPPVCWKKCSYHFCIVAGGSHLDSLFTSILSPTRGSCECPSSREDDCQACCSLWWVAIHQQIAPCEAPLTQWLNPAHNFHLQPREKQSIGWCQIISGQAVKWTIRLAGLS